MNRIALLISMFALAMLPSMTTATTETITWIHTDHLGSPMAGRNDAGETAWEQAYAPWGEIKPWLAYRKRRRVWAIPAMFMTSRLG